MTADQLVTMTEDELFEGITQALTIAGWRWSHIRDSRGITVGDSGLPDIIAVHPTRGLVLAWELKGTNGKPTGDQVAWIAGMSAPGVKLDARILYPGHYDRALAFITGKTPAFVTCIVCGAPAVRMVDPRSDSGLCDIHDDLDA